MQTNVLCETKTNNESGASPPRLPDSLEIQRYNERYMCGNALLPIAKERERIVQTILNNQVTIITTTTGGGKSTQVPQFLAETGKFNKVYVTQPRILACRTLYERVQEEMTSRLGESANNLVGWRTAEEENVSPENIIEYCTDGLQLMRELTGSGIGEGDILVLDEIHEWNANMSLLAALAKRHNIKLVVMSATMDCDGLSKYYANENNEPAPVIEVIGSTFPVEERFGGSITDNAIEYTAENKNILIIVPGKPDIKRTIDELRGRLPSGYPIFGLHGEQIQSEQDKIFGNYASGKIIVATKVAQTSITIPDLDVVLDCGWERTGLARNDVDSLTVIPTSFASQDQRKGRVGRTKPGIYHRAQLNGYPDLDEDLERDRFDIPDLLKMRIDSVFLKFLGNAGIKLSDLDIYDKPSEEKTQAAVRRLQRIGALAYDETVTEIGSEMALLPLDIHQARMVIESRQFNDATRRLLIAAIVANADGGIVKSDRMSEEAFEYFSNEQNSDVLQMLDVIIKSQSLTSKEMDAKGIVVKKYLKAISKYEQLLEHEGIPWEPLEEPTDKQRRDIIRCIIVGSDELYLPIRRRGHIDPRGRMRKLHKGSPLKDRGTLLVGSPFDLGNMKKSGLSYSNFIRGATRVDTQLLIEAAPERCTFESLKYIIEDNGSFAQESTVLFDFAATGDTLVQSIEPSEEVKDTIIEQLVLENELKFALPNIRAIKHLINQVVDIQDRVAFDIGIEGIIDSVITKCQDAVPATVANIYDLDASLPTLHVYDYVDNEQINSIYANTPDTFVIDDEEVNVYYRNGKAYATLPSTVDVDKIASYMPKIKAELFVRYPQFGSRFHTIEKIAKIVKNGPRRQRRNTSSNEDDVSEPFKQKDKYRRDRLAKVAVKNATLQVSSKQPAFAGQRR